MKKMTHQLQKPHMNNLHIIRFLALFIVITAAMTVSYGYRNLIRENLFVIEEGDTIRVRVNNLKSTVFIIEDSISERTMTFYKNNEFTSVFRNKALNKGTKCDYNSAGELDRKWDIRWPSNAKSNGYANEHYMGDVDFPGVIVLEYLYDGAFYNFKSDTILTFRYKDGVIVR